MPSGKKNAHSRRQALADWQAASLNSLARIYIYIYKGSGAWKFAQVGSPSYIAICNPDEEEDCNFSKPS